ncbi:Ras-related protein Rab-3B [Cricetulus griseus]|uniref:Ras-related protein Rab-3B n=1 Tax=Cricetulus griseus TaxID=10029 RepID=G3GVY8_CRIGR|nr:Ras-related protein Rab-3B [Cricetulus griseus]
MSVISKCFFSLPFSGQERGHRSGFQLEVGWQKEPEPSSGFDFFEASAKENISVRQAFERLVDAICDKMSDSLDTDPSVLGASKTTRLSDTPPLLQQNCSC